MLQVCTDKLQEMGLKAEHITVATVPGALEVALVLRTSGQPLAAADALVAIGAVIRGKTYHYFELVANGSGAAITRVGLDFNVPIANAVLTTENDERAHVRIEEKPAMPPWWRWNAPT